MAPKPVPGVVRVLIDCDRCTLDLAERGLVSLVSRFLTRWYRHGLELVAVTRGSSDELSQALEAAQIRRFFEQVLSLSELAGQTAAAASIASLLFDAQRRDGWVPREQLYVGASIDSITSLWCGTSGAQRKACLAHTVRFPGALMASTVAELLEIVSELIFMPPASTTTHVYAMKYDGVTSVDKADSMSKLRFDGLPTDEARRHALAQVNIDEQDTAVAGRPDLADLLPAHSRKTLTKATPGRGSIVPATVRGQMLFTRDVLTNAVRDGTFTAKLRTSIQVVAGSERGVGQGSFASAW